MKTLTERHEIPAIAENGRIVRDLVEKFCAGLGLSGDLMEGLQLAACEAFNNAAEHGLGFNGAEPVTISLKAENGKLTIEIEDRGAGIDFKRLSYFGSMLNLSERGRGFQIIGALLDGVQVERISPKGTRFILIKWID